MSNQYGQNRHDPNKSFPKPQKKYIPKTPNVEPDSNRTLSNSLRQSLSPQPHVAAAATSTGGGATASGSRVRIGDSGNWISSRIQGGRFVNYLPQDEAVAAGFGAGEGGLDPLESQRVVDLLNRELSRLLRLNPRDFWREVASDSSLHEFLESFLKFKIRWYDFPHRGAKGIVAGVIVGELELNRRVFMALYRISSNRDPGARSADSLSPKAHAVLLQEKKLLDLPKLLDICAIYGHENEDLTRLVVVNALKAQVMIHDNFTAAVSHFLGIVHTMHQRCSSSLEILFSSHGLEDQGSSRLHSDYLEVMDFINDAVVSMDAFFSAYKPAAVYFSCPVELSDGNEELLSTLVRLHDFLLPSLQRGFRILFTMREDGPLDNSADMLSNIALSLKMLSVRIVKLGWKLLDFCYLGDEVFQVNFPLPSATKMFPANVEDPIIRADILVQTLREIGWGSSSVHEDQNRGTFLQNLEKNHQMMSRIDFLQNTGWISMDDEQVQYLSAITKHHSEAKIMEKPHVPGTVTSNNIQMNEDAVIIESKVSQIKDLFPDYGKGFLSACLEVYSQNPEEVIQRILEGTLHDDLQSLDTSLETILPPKSSIVSRNDKGKGKMLEPATASSADLVPTSREKQSAAPSISSSSSSKTVGRFVRKYNVVTPDSETLNSRDEKDLERTAALVAQLEYEDEYDDSFDDLGMSVADSGLEETEIRGSERGKPWETDTGSSTPNPAHSKWNSRQKPQYFVKDGKNYSYKVAGSVAVGNYNDASIVNQSQRELIHGLGHGGNVPLGAVRKMMESNKDQNEECDAAEVGERGYVGNFRGRGRRGGGGRNNYRDSNEDQNDEPDAAEVGGRGNSGNPRGRGRRGGGGRNSYRKDQAMKKHFSGLTGF